MAQVWLRTNTRFWSLAMVPAGLLSWAGALLAAHRYHVADGALGWAGIVGMVLATVGLLMIVLCAWQLRRPRLAYEPPSLLVYLRGGEPQRVPLALVECFLLGRGPSFLPGRQHAKTETTTLVVRLAERALEWSHIETDPRLGSWCDRHIIIRGTWCEPLSVDLAHRLNARLAEAQRGLHSSTKKRA